MIIPLPTIPRPSVHLPSSSSVSSLPKSGIPHSVHSPIREKEGRKRRRGYWTERWGEGENALQEVTGEGMAWIEGRRKMEWRLAACLALFPPSPLLLFLRPRCMSTFSQKKKLIAGPSIPFSDRKGEGKKTEGNAGMRCIRERHACTYMPVPDFLL